jgi:uncharacterized protein YabE (DUF348 family)
MRIKFDLKRIKLTRPRRLPSWQGIKGSEFWRRRMVAVPAATIGILLVVTGVVYVLARQTNKLPPVHDAKIVIISHDDKQQVVPSKEKTVGSLLQKLNIKINNGDVVEPAQTALITQDEFRINIYRAVPVEIVDGGNHSFGFSASRTPRAIAQQAGTSLYPEDDTITQPVQDFLKTGAIGEQVVVNRATPINVDLYGTQVVLRTQAKTIGGLIKEKNIKIIPKDQIVPAPNTPITPGQQVSFIRTGVKTETVNEEIAMPIQSLNDDNLAYGTSAVRQQGSPGQQVVTYQVSITNNVETGRNVIQKVVNRQPVTQIVVVGTSLSGIKGDMALAGIAPGDYQYVDYIVSRESGWCPTKAQGQYGGCPPYSGSVPSYGGYGLCQSTPGSKMASAGADWATNPITQLKWCSGYAIGRYGSWAAAYNHWVSYHNW